MDPMSPNALTGSKKGSIVTSLAAEAERERRMARATENGWLGAEKKK